VFLSRFSLSLCVCRGSAIDFEWIFSLSLPNGPPSFKSVSFPSLSLSYSTRDIPPAIKVQRSGNSAHTHVYYTGGVICCGREPIGIRRSLSHFEPSDTRRDRGRFHAHFFASIYTKAQKVYRLLLANRRRGSDGPQVVVQTHTCTVQAERERERVGRAGKMLCTQGRNRERL
jgi:hypothetical protein